MYAVIHFLESRCSFCPALELHQRTTGRSSGSRPQAALRAACGRPLNFDVRMLQHLISIILVVTAAPVLGQESERVRQLEQEVKLIKSTVADQGRRIEMLERELRGKSSVTESGASTATQSRTPSSTAYPWHDRNSWGRVKNGMSEAQVMSILGHPTSVEAMGGIFKTLFYRGEVAGSGSVELNR